MIKEFRGHKNLNILDN